MTAAGDASHGELLDVLRVALAALDIPNAATVGDEKIRAEILRDRMFPVVRLLQDLVGPEAKPQLDMAWEVSYVREQLAIYPATGYRLYSELAADPEAFYAGGGHVDG